MVLGGQHYGVNADHLAAFVAAGDLALGVRAQPGQQAVFTRFGLALHQTVSVGNRCRHQHIGFIAGKAKHQALIASALIFQAGAVNALSNVRRLLADDVDNAAGGTVIADIRAVVADTGNDITHQLFQINPGAGADFAGNDCHTGFYQGFTGDAGVFVFADDGIQHRIGNLVGNFVRMAFGDRFGGKNGIFTHEMLSPLCA